MDLNDYTLMLLLQDRHEEMVVAARRDALLREATRPRHPFRATLGTVLVRLDAWLQAFWTVRAANAIGRCHGDSSINTPRCGGRRRLVGVHIGGEPLRALLERRGLGSASPSAEPSRSPPRASQ